MNPKPIAPTQLLEALRWRYATKAFDPSRKLSAEIWSTLEASIILSASSFGLQPYRLIVVNDLATREKLMPHAWNQRQVVDASHFVVFAARTSVTEAEIDAFVQHIVATRGVPADSLAGYRGMMTGMLLSEGFKPMLPHWTARQAYIALGNLLTCAALLGVDACPMEGFAPAEFDRILGLPAQGLTAAVACALGYRSQADKYATLAKVRFPKSQLVKTA
jgi:nitroreductase